MTYDLDINFDNKSDIVLVGNLDIFISDVQFESKNKFSNNLNNNSGNLIIDVFMWKSND